MIRIAVCDDDAKELDLILSLLDDFKKEYPQYPFTVKSYHEPFTLLGQAEEIGGFDIYLLDIIMPGIIGIDCAKELRKRGDEGEIVFLTTSTEYGVDAFALDAMNYLVKPVKRDALFKCLKKAWEKTESISTVAIKLIGGDLRTVRTNEIVCIESFNYYREIRLANGEIIKTHTTLQQWKDTFAAYPEFYMPNKSYIVNFGHVESITSQCINARGYIIPLPRGTMKAAQKVYFDYLMKK